MDLLQYSPEDIAFFCPKGLSMEKNRLFAAVQGTLPCGLTGRRCRQPPFILITDGLRISGDAADLIQP